MQAAKTANESFQVLATDEQLFRKVVTADFRLLGQHVQLWNCHFPAKGREDIKTEARTMGRLVKAISSHLPQQAHLIVLGDFNMASTDPSWDEMKKVMCPLSAQSPHKGLFWGTNFDGTQHYDDIWVGLQAHGAGDWGSNAQICIPHKSILEKGQEAYGWRLGVQTRASSKYKVAAVYPNHRLIWAEFAAAAHRSVH